MIKINKYSYPILNKMLLGKTVRFNSDCEFFPHFDVIGKVVELKMKNSEILIDIIIKHNHKRITIGSNMKNLRFEILSS